MLKRGSIAEFTIERTDYPNRGRCDLPEGQKVTIKNTLPGQKVEARIFKKHKERLEGKLLRVVEPSPLESEPAACDLFPECGGCLLQTVSYENQLRQKADQVRRLLAEVSGPETVFDGIFPSPQAFAYRNKMEFSFGDDRPDGPVNLGLHRRGTTYDVLDASSCRLVHPDLTKILAATQEYCRQMNFPKYNKKIHVGVLRYLLLRRSETNGEILAYLVTSGQTVHTFDKWAQKLLELPLEGTFAGIFHGIDDAKADALIVERANCLYGRDYFYEELLGLRFRVTAFSFFQTNTRGAEVLYKAVRDYVLGSAPEGGLFADMPNAAASSASADRAVAHASHSDQEVTPTAQPDLEKNSSVILSEAKNLAYRSSMATLNSAEAEPQGDTAEKRLPVIYDLYSGTGTIGQMLSPAASHVYGIELVEVAVAAANRNAAENGLTNCTFLAGDVLARLGDLPEKPDYIVLDPPREGVNPKALAKIIDYGLGKMVYISCKASSFRDDMTTLRQHGWHIRRWCLVDMFPQTQHVETVVLLTRQNT
ncbi:MAG: class I SAM-dependent RNA methyltransferase [Lachnospiraceae bacterium]